MMIRILVLEKLYKNNKLLLYFTIVTEELGENHYMKGQTIEDFDGVLPFNDKASPEVIKRETGMSKNEFKSYPEGYRKLMKKLVPWYFGPMREKMIRLLLTILTDG